jgi:GMP reductase
MKSVVDEETCEAFARLGWFYTMHRFNVDACRFTAAMQEKGLFASISAGVNEDTLQQLAELKAAGLTPEYITLDVANAWCVKAERMIKHIKDTFPATFLIGGNIATADAARDLKAGAVMPSRPALPVAGCALPRTRPVFTARWFPPCVTAQQPSACR